MAAIAKVAAKAGKEIGGAIKSLKSSKTGKVLLGGAAVGGGVALAGAGVGAGVNTALTGVSEGLKTAEKNTEDGVGNAVKGIAKVLLIAALVILVVIAVPKVANKAGRRRN